MIGDHINEGADRFGEAAHQEFSGTGFAATTFANYQRIARLFSKEQRELPLSVSHWVALGQITDTDKRNQAVKDAVKHGYDTRQLRALATKLNR